MRCSVNVYNEQADYEYIGRKILQIALQAEAEAQAAQRTRDLAIRGANHQH